jgi:hypothetical protein
MGPRLAPAAALLLLLAAVAAAAHVRRPAPSGKPITPVCTPLNAPSPYQKDRQCKVCACGVRLDRAPSAASGAPLHARRKASASECSECNATPTVRPAVWWATRRVGLTERRCQCPPGSSWELSELKPEKPNGCGPAGTGWYTHIVTAVAQYASRGKGWDLNPACNTHDRCYNSCGAVRRTCDLKLKNGMLAICGRLKSGAEKTSCTFYANVIAKAVPLGGRTAFESYQAKKCKCVAVRLTARLRRATAAESP